MKRIIKKQRDVLPKGATVKCDIRPQCWANPYETKLPGVISVQTGLDRQFRYSPIFENYIADTMVELTGYRQKDYLIAEKQTGKVHIPKKTVWHHVWEEQDGKYRMQLVYFKEHQKTCPHAGGCRLWLTKTKKKKKYTCFINSVKERDYSDYVMYDIENKNRGYILNSYVGRSTLSLIHRKHAKLVGMDMYGNLFYSNGKTLYFWDHETGLLNPVRGLKGGKVFIHKKGRHNTCTRRIKD